MVKFIRVKICWSAEIHTCMCTIYGLACVAQTTVVDQFCTFQMGGTEKRTLRNWNAFTLLLIQRKKHINNAVHEVKCWTTWLLSTARERRHPRCAHNPTRSWTPQVYPAGPTNTVTNTRNTFSSTTGTSAAVPYQEQAFQRHIVEGNTMWCHHFKTTRKPIGMQCTEPCEE